ncbi:response regulator [Acetivibrio saccincola]|jgi:two-component system chemotaxis response regulator CheY|uniref:Stage 0 sporulation protein A homolog n=1 Tax=Acetivibrio saccincola TaxID=1677857 RepID=A0A2K9E280_9FIRM|nr:response regulator [Acetivibrio saccincola]AUG57867.1 Chemotaxis protein CheY [Acetivibrio saccincola]NLW26802.1 response regulator [Acetivibrio saccincola]PQQ67747.1 response regulator [Acetivibrio saccincola]HOA96606.1 response regulator [Acetivibrio saccincola]HQD29445.1 response regulator [Acetivibrio saccincola]
MKRVLIADDAAFMRTSLRLMLEKNGYKIVAEAENGNVAFDKYKEVSPDIVTMDITMPICNGIEAVKKIKEYDKDAKIIMISSMGQESFVREAVLAGAKGFIVKPFKEETVIEAIKRL